MKKTGKKKKKNLCGEKKGGLVRESNPGPLAPEARIIPLDQQACEGKKLKIYNKYMYVVIGVLVLM